MKKPVTENVSHYSLIRSLSNVLPVLILIFILLPVHSQAEPITISGFTEPYLDSMLGMAVIGTVTQIYLAEGASVKEGEVILDLDQEFEKLEAKRRKLIWESKAEIQSAALQVQTLKPHLSATQELYKKTGSVRREDMENQELEYALAADELNRLEDAEKREEIEYSIAKQRLFERSLRAPFSGRIAELLTHAGENCQLDVPLVHLVNTSRGYFVANVDLAISREFTMGQTVQLKLQSGSDPLTCNAEIVFISPIVDPASGLRKVKALFDNQEGKIVIGIAGDMIINTQN